MVKNQSSNATTSAISVNTEIISWHNIASVAMIDAKSVSTDCNKYVETNRFQYYTVCNSWLILIHEILGDRAQHSVKNTIMRDGLLATIDAASNIANQLIKYNQDGTEFCLPMGWFIPVIKDMDLRDALQALRYPKRFSPTNADILYKNSIKRFREINSYDKITNHMNYPDWICDRMRVHLSNMLKYFSTEYKKTIPHFSSGSTTCGRTLERKLKEYSTVRYYWCDPLYPIGDVRGFQKNDDPGPMKGYYFTPIVKAVPKNYKTYRIIAPEHPFYAAEKQRIKDAIRASIKRTKYGKMYDPEHQDYNQELAREGAICGSYATIDLTSASDTVADNFAYYVLPSCLTDVTRCFHADYINIDNDWCIKRMFATSGDPICFDVEAMIFLSIALSCQDIATELTGEKYLNPSVYGDDIVIDSRLFETVMDVLGILRFIPNGDKSFGTGGYRESCGVEYYYGYDTSTHYWPRTTMLDPRKDVASLESLVSVQRNTFNWWHVSAFLADVCHIVYPKITSSEPGTDCSDLWADSPWCALRSAPFKRDADTPSPDPLWTRREAHTTFIAKSDNKDRWTPDIDMYHYVNFLHDGPLYMSALDELLGISTRVSRDSDFGSPKITVTNTVN